MFEDYLNLPKSGGTAKTVAKPAAKTTTSSLAGPDGKYGVFWVGQNGNVYTKDNKGVTTNRGPANKDADMSKWRQIADWNKAETPPPVNNGGTVYPDLSGAIEILRQNISALDPIYQKQVAQAIQDYDIAQNERKTAYAKAQTDSENTGVKNDQTVLNSRNAINKNARMSSEDILSILGALGMTGSTTGKALGTIADKSNEDMNTANYGYGQNKQSILQSWNDYVNADKNQQTQLEDSKNYNIAQAGITRATGKKDLLGQIAADQISSGKFNTNDILGEITGANNEIANLSGVNKAYTGVTPVYTAPAISTLLGQNLARFDVTAGSGASKTPAKLVKVNEQTPTGDKYGLVQ